MVEEPHIIAIFGPTASGKSTLAVEAAVLLSERGRTPVIVSADSIAVYRELPLLSGTLPDPERKGIRHEMVGVRSVVDRFSAGEYASEAHPLIDAALAEQRPVIVVGGTGLYVRAALSDLEMRPPVPAGIREKWQARLERDGASTLHGELAALDADVAGRIEPNDGRRVTRALELIESGVEPAGGSEGLWDAPKRKPAFVFGIERDPAELRSRIEERAAGMLESGVADEVAAAERLGASPTAMAAIGWQEALDGDLEALVTRTWQFARRQRTWSRRMRDMIPLPLAGSNASAQAAELIGLVDGLTDPLQRS